MTKQPTAPRLFSLAAVVVWFCLLFTVQAGPGSALSFNGTNSYVAVPNNAALDAFPLTVTAWIRTTRVAPLYDGILNKYSPGSGNGYSLHVYNGHVYAWYFHNGTSYVYPADPGMDGGFVADGNWHHIAFVITPTNGALYVDGHLGGSLAWTGTAGPPTTTVPILLGCYATNLANSFAGSIDEVTLWNRALAPAELNYLKHRSLAPNADGLVSYWKFDDGSGTIAGDSTANHFNGTLVNNLQWIASDAPVVLSPVATNCLKFAGSSGIVTVANASDLDAYPFTATAWFRTQTNSSAVQVIAAKYTDVSYNGWALAVQSGQLRGFFYRAGSVANKAIDALSGTLVADGGWHHAALVVDASGGRLFLDGSLVVSNGWSGTAGAGTSTAPLTLGAMANGYPLLGDVDEVTFWSRALSASEIAAQENLPRVGNEANLVGYWKLDEGTGTTTADSTANFHTGTLSGAVSWTGSCAYLGDGSVHLVDAMNFINFTQTFAINHSPGQPAFVANSGAGFWRFYDFGAAPPSSTEIAQITPALQIAGTGTPISINPVTSVSTNIFGAYNASSPIGSGVGNGQLFLTPNLNLQPASGVQLDAVDNLHQAVAVLSHNENGGAFSNDATNASAATRLLQFDGNLFCGPVLTLISNFDQTPVVSNIVAASYLNCSLVISANGSYLPGAPGHTFGGDGTLLPVSLAVNGDATLQTNATTLLFGPTNDTASVQNISFNRSALMLTSTGAVGYVTMTLPAGFCVGVSETNHLTINVLKLGTIPLDGNLDPVSSSLVVPGPLFGVEETLPYWFDAANLTWQVAAGQIVLNPTSGAFVRQTEDDYLTGVQPTLVETNVANRISNDGYFRNAQPAGPLMITADSNGVALISAQLALNPPELRPHFPYTTDAPGAQIPTGTGTLVITDNLVGAGSLLNVTGPVPVYYGRDCTYKNCNSELAGPAILNFSTSGGQFAFTPDGGLLAYGSVPSTNLQWGYATGGNFAQTAGSVGAGAFCMAGTFLRANQNTLTEAEGPAVLLFSGFGDASNPAYFERPGQSAYNDGFANYPGINFRSPAQGASYVGQQNSGWYALDAVSKYYVRDGGVNGIHQAQAGSFPTSTLFLYGYQFTFTDFGLSYLDGQNWQSVTAGAIAFPPEPAGFTQEFDQMKLTCRGDLDSADIPAGSGSKHMAYWNVNITPESLDFHPTNDDSCGTSPRFLVLGVQTKLPFISQTLDAALGFKPNGNLVTVLDNVSNVDSRFEVPGTLYVQGPSNELFTLSTATEGYFNNWETPGAKDVPGFYNLGGELGVFFFKGVKVHVHVTPNGTNTAQIAVMGGWPAADSTAADFGWSMNGSNYFNEVKFDPNADGWPQAQGVALTDYRNSATESYHPRAQQEWIEVATFDYPLVWNDALRSFNGFAPAKVILPVIDVNSDLKELDPGKADIDFAQDINVQLPRLKVLDLVNDALDGNIGPLQTVSNVVAQVLGQILDVTGLNSLQHALSADSRKFLDPIIQQAIGPLLDPVSGILYTNIASLPQTNIPVFLNQVYQIVSQPAGVLSNAIAGMNGATGQVNTVVGTLDQTLSDVQDTIGLLNRMLNKDTNGNRQVVSILIQKLVSDQSGPPLSLFTQIADTQLNSILNDLDPTLTQIQTELQDVSNQVAQVHSSLTLASGDFNTAMTSALTDATGMQQFLQAAAVAMTNQLSAELASGSDYFTANPANARQAMMDDIEGAFLGSLLQNNFSQTVHGFLYDKNFLLDQIMSTLFDQINSSIREGLTSQITGAQDGVPEQMKGISALMRGSLLAAKITGSPIFNGHSLQDIHLTANVQLNVPSPMNFQAFMDIKELDSQSVGIACVPPGAPAAEVTIGANQVPLDWQGVSSGNGQSLTLTLDARWTLQQGAVLGIGGSLDINGQPSLEGFSLKDIGAMLAIGETENYFVAKGSGTMRVFGVPVDMDAGIFAGHACSLDPLMSVDPGVTSVLPNATEFSGLYLQFGGGMSLSEMLFGESSDALDIEANTSTAIYYLNGPSYSTIGGRQDISVAIKLFYVLSGSADWSVFMALDSNLQLTLGGSAQVCGSIGPCPFCEQGCTGVTVKGVVNTGGINYYIDY